MRALLIFIVLISACDVSAQKFVGEVKVPLVSEDGFYKLFLSEKISSHLNDRFSNIRIYDGNNKEVPYLFQQEVPHRTTAEFKEYSIVEKKQVDGCCTTLLLHNPGQNLLNTITLVVKNADVTKDATLLGSDDKEHWFALKQHFILHPTANDRGTSEVKIVDFPLSNYSYYSLRIGDSVSAPLNILKAGYFEVHTENGHYTEVPIAKINKTDSIRTKKSYFHFVFDGARMIDKLELSMKGFPYFLRKATLYTSKHRVLKNGRNEKYYDQLQEVELSSKQSTIVEWPVVKTPELLMVVENEDNPALEIDTCKAFGLNRYLTAWLKKDEPYVLKISGDELASPVYDLSFFKDSIPGNPDVISMGEVTLLSKGQAQESFTFFTTRIFIWVAVIIVIVILGFMSVRLLNEASSSSDKK